MEPSVQSTLFPRKERKESLEVFTIGYANWRFSDWLTALQERCIRLIVDVRRWPNSGSNSEFFKDYLASSLPKNLKYHHCLDLAPPEKVLKSFKTKRDWVGFREAFIGHLKQREQKSALTRLVKLIIQKPVVLIVKLIIQKPVVLMCAEADSRYCHRRLIAEEMWEALPELKIQHIFTKVC